MPDAALLTQIRATLTGSPFHGEGHRKVWARLRLRGVRTSKRRVLRLMRNHDLLAPSRVGTPRGPRNHDGTIADSDGSRPPIPTRSRPAFRFDVGHHSEMKPATR